MRDSVKSVDRTFIILEHLRKARMPLTLAEIARPLGLPMSSTLDIVKSMAALGYLAFDPLRKTYFPTLNLTRLSAWIPDILDASGDLSVFVHMLSLRTDLSVFVGQLNDLFTEHVAFEIRSDGAHDFDPRIRVPALMAPLGLMLLSGELPDRVDRLYRRSVAEGLLDRRVLPPPYVLRMCGDLIHEDTAVFTNWPVEDFAVFTSRLAVTLAGRRLAVGVGGAQDQVLAALPDIQESLGCMLTELRLPSPVGRAKSPRRIDARAFNSGFWPAHYIITPLEDRGTNVSF